MGKKWNFKIIKKLFHIKEDEIIVNLINKEYSFKTICNGNCIEGIPIYEQRSISYLSDYQEKGNIFSLYIGYTSLDFSDFTNMAIGFDGYNSFYGWKKESLYFPISRKGEIYIENNIKDLEIRSEYYTKNWITYYDEEKNILCIGDYNTKEEDIAIEFFTNTVAVFEEKYLKAIWIKNMEFKDKD